MKKFEYKVETKIRNNGNVFFGSIDEKVFLIQNGDNGWELCNCTMTEHSFNTNRYYYYFKREITKNATN